MALNILGKKWARKMDVALQKVVSEPVVDGDITARTTVQVHPFHEQPNSDKFIIALETVVTDSKGNSLNLKYASDSISGEELENESSFWVSFGNAYQLMGGIRVKPNDSTMTTASGGTSPIGSSFKNVLSRLSTDTEYLSVREFAMALKKMLVKLNKYAIRKFNGEAEEGEETPASQTEGKDMTGNSIEEFLLTLQLGDLDYKKRGRGIVKVTEKDGIKSQITIDADGSGSVGVKGKGITAGFDFKLGFSSKGMTITYSNGYLKGNGYDKDISMGPVKRTDNGVDLFMEIKDILDKEVKLLVKDVKEFSIDNSERKNESLNDRINNLVESMVVGPASSRTIPLSSMRDDQMIDFPAFMIILKKRLEVVKLAIPDLPDMITPINEVISLIENAKSADEKTMTKIRTAQEALSKKMEIYNSLNYGLSTMVYMMDSKKDQSGEDVPETIQNMKNIFTQNYQQY